MILKTNKRGRESCLHGRMSPWIECEEPAGNVSDQLTTAYFEAGPAHGLVRLSWEEIVRLVAANAPTDSEARETFYQELKKTVSAVNSNKLNWNEPS